MSIRVSFDGEVAIFEFDNGKVNALTPEMHRELHEALFEFERHETVKVGILIGAEGKPFCAGDDIKTPMPKRSPPEQVLYHFNRHAETNDHGRPGWEVEVMQFRRSKPIIGAVRQWCLGQGMIYLLMLTDIRIAEANARFGFPEIAYGMAGAGGMARLMRQIPPVVAMRLLLTGDFIDAHEALRIDLINEVVEEGALLARAKEIAARITRHPMLALRTEMEASYECADMSRDQALNYANHLFRLQRLGLAAHGTDSGFLKSKV